LLFFKEEHAKCRISGRKVSVLYYTLGKKFHAPDVTGDVLYSFEWITAQLITKL